MHFLDLPVLQRQPSAQALGDALKELLPTQTRDFDAHAELDRGTRQWLARLAGSDLSWISEEEAENLRSLAAQRLAMECGVTASSSQTRTVELGLLSSGSGTEMLTVQLHEPGMTEDNLGRLTWGSSLVLSRRLVRQPELVAGKSVLELGAGTGLCGITASLVGAAIVDVTDLPEIVPNLADNVELNAARCSAYILDWACLPSTSASRAFDVCIVSDPVYSREHPPLLLDAVKYVSSPVVLLQLPLRAGFEGEREQIFSGLVGQGYTCVDSQEEQGRDLFGEQTFLYRKYQRSL